MTTPNFQTRKQRDLERDTPKTSEKSEMRDLPYLGVGATDTFHPSVVELGELNNSKKKSITQQVLGYVIGKGQEYIPNVPYLRENGLI